MKKIIDVIIPAFNEEESIGLVLNDIPKGLVRQVVVANNNSTDHTSVKATEAGAVVVDQPEQGYGAACLRAIEHSLKTSPPPDVLVFLDADYSDHPEEMPLLLEPILSGKAELVIGSRSSGVREKGSMMPQQVFGNWLATFLMKIMYGSKFTDLGPFRAITRRAYEEIGMVDRNFGWTVEMQVKALKKKIAHTEIPVTYRRRKGVSKVSGTVKGSILAGYKIIYTIFKYA
ncbi:glycosyltransferase family 2 protein [Cryomorphaceae bacterium 1068]|nr:glycosyltransferase family 2 protein [Cryomorphaceae bacterium 1068]